MTYLIIGSSAYGTEEIDETDTLEEAKHLLAEYRLAFGPGWSLRIRPIKKAA